MTTKIKSAKIFKETKLTVNLIQEDGDVLKTCKTDVHPDLKQSFANMAMHLAVLCGYTFSEDVKDIKTDTIDEFFVRGYSISKDDIGFVLSGHHITPSGMAVILNSPFTRFEQAEETAYIFIDDIREKLDRAEKEVRLYLFEGKKAQDPQGTLFVDQEGVLEPK